MKTNGHGTRTSLNRQKNMISTARKAFASRKTIPYSFRLNQLKKLKQMLTEGQEEICGALALDLRRHKGDCLVEIGLALLEVEYHIQNLKSNMKGERPLRGVTTWLAGFDAHIVPEPYGVVAIISPWNFPVGPAMIPLAGAIAAGNCVIVKHSELSSNTSAAFSRLMLKYLDNECYQSLETDLEGSKDFLTHKFDYIFFTGSSRVGRFVMESAARHLTPVQLELGGKSPVYIDDSADIESAVLRILTFKCLNLGQVCLSPDYILCSKKVQAEFVRVAKIVLEKHLGSNMKENPGLGRIINKHHYDRLVRLLNTSTGRVVFGGNFDENEKWISPTIIADVSSSDAIMKEEIFGPLLPICTVETPEAAIEEILSRPKPLALYIFSKDEVISSMFVERVSCGNVCVNDVVATLPFLPFGGVGESGMGKYYWKHTFDAFSHKKTVVRVRPGWPLNKFDKFRFPPYPISWAAKFVNTFNVFPIFFWVWSAFMNFSPRKIISYFFVFIFGMVISAIFL